MSEEDEKLMRFIDQIYMKYPFKGSRRICSALGDIQGVRVSRDRVRRLMGIMGLRGLSSLPKTTRAGEGHTIYPYLLRGEKIERANQVWAADITYISMSKGFLYLVAVMDWYSRKVLSYRLSNTMDTEFCVEAVKDALDHYGTPGIFNTDQGSQFTSRVFTEVLKKNNIRISMDGKRSWVDNVFIERLWRSLKYEEVYLKAYDSVRCAKEGIGGWIDFYNRRRRHTGIGKLTPDEVYRKALGEEAKVA